jgi:2-oxoisovalerate dehydrogenase E1 component
MAKETLEKAALELDFQSFKEEILNDYKLASISREASLLGRREVLTGKAKFGIFGDGKELAQIALAKQFQDGDFRSGYYRDQTILMSIGELNVKQYFAALYAHTDIEKEPASGGRQMGGHYATRSLDENGEWKNLMSQKNSSADISPTAGQMPRLLGLAQASKVYRENELLHTSEFSKFSNKGNEVAFGTIGDASTSEGLFWETMNAAGVLQVPMVMSVWDDGYGISVSKKYQTIKESISEALSGFQRTKDKPGFEIFKTKGWDYPHLVATYEKAVKIAREEHVPVLIHVEEVNQPQGHSTSGSHERYKSEERMQWEQDFDCIAKFKEFILGFKTEDGAVIASAEELEAIEKEAKSHVRDQKNDAWKDFTGSIKSDIQESIALMSAAAAVSPNKVFIEKEIDALKSAFEPIRKDIFNTVRKVLRMIRGEKSSDRQVLLNWLNKQFDANFDRYSSKLFSESSKSVLNINPVAIEYASEEKMEDGRVVLRENFDALFSKFPEMLTFGEDTGKIGGVNQSMEGMQAKYGKLRVSDTGIRECTILGQGIGLSMRGLRPIAEIQYLDYLLYAIQIMSDDLATVQYRTKGGQKAPLIVRTRGHRLEGIWHSGSPMGMIINSIRGIHVCVPRNMTQAAGMYNTLMHADEPALVIEPLNGYRTKERIPSNLGDFRIPLGIPETLREGEHMTMLSYGSTLNICNEACKELERLGVSVELIDVQTLLPFDIHETIVDSLEKTNRLMIVDEDVSSGATAYILDQVLVKQGGYYHLDSQPVTLSAKDHRPAYGSDGDYFSKPSFDDIVETAYAMMTEVDPNEFPAIR